MSTSLPGTLSGGSTIRAALEGLNRSGGHQTVFVLDDEGRLIGSVTDGDVRRGLLAGNTVDDLVTRVMNPAPQRLVLGDDASDMIGGLKAKGIRLLPVIDTDGRLVQVKDLDGLESILPIEAVIMAGGRGERLRPYTDTMPKSLIGVAGKPIIEYTLGLLKRYGIEHTSISVNYLRERIKEHVGDGSNWGLTVRYLEEDRPLGTAGALGLLTRPKYETVLLMNSDLLTDIALDAMYRRFKASHADLVIATTDHLVNLPFAVMDLEGERVTSFREKPLMAFPCNAGIYMMKREVLERVPRDAPYNATDIIQDLLDHDRVVVAFPISGTWFDIGNHEDLERARLVRGAT
jgi:dTDP-glucose pyrophosphorylase